MTNITKAAQQALEALYAMAEGSTKGFAGSNASWGRIVMPTDSALNKAESAITALRAALQDKAGEVPDVARYRAIRDGLVYIEPHESGEIYVAGVTGVYTKSGDEFDAAIDAITASQQKGWSAG